MSDDVTIPRAKFENLLDLAANSIYVEMTEFSNYPGEFEIELMEDMHEIAGKAIDPCLAYAIKCGRDIQSS